MGYATVSHVEAYTPARAPFTANTKPSASGVALLIEEATVEVEDALLRAGYPVPIPSTASVAFRTIRSVVARTTAYLVEQVAPTSDRRDATRAMRDAALKMIADGELVGVDKDIDQSNPRSGNTGATAYFYRDQPF